MRLGFQTIRTLLLFFAFGAACKGPVGVELSLPNHLPDKAVWIEVGAFNGASCTAVGSMLPNGVPPGFTARVAFRRDSKSPPSIGDIPRGQYAFGAVARSETCAVVAAGCTEVDIGSTDSVAIALKAQNPPAGECAVGASCQAATCVPATDNSDPGVGAGCSLELLGAGPLAQTLGASDANSSSEGTLVSAPAIAPTSTGFLIAYREISSSGAARLVLLPVDLSGGALTPQKPVLPGRCANSGETDGVGLIVRGTDGLIALARSPCDKEAALELLNLKTTTDDNPGSPVTGTFLVSSAGGRPVLGAARAAALRASGGVVVFSEGGTGHVATMDPQRGITSPTGTFGGAGVTGTWVAATANVLALLAAGTDGAIDPNLVDASALETGATLRLLMMAPDTPVDAISTSAATPITFSGTWASIAAIAGRVIVVSGGGSGPNSSATYRTFDLNGEGPTDTGGLRVDGNGKVTAGDVTILGNRVYFAALSQGAIALHVFNNATTTPTLLVAKSLAQEPRISAINTIRDGRVAVAATGTRVAVVWTTASVLERNDRAGGYAVFGCTK